MKYALGNDKLYQLNQHIALELSRPWLYKVRTFDKMDIIIIIQILALN